MDCFKLVLTLDNFSTLLHVWGPFTHFSHRHSQHWWGAISPPSCTLFFVYKLKCMFKARRESGAASMMRHIMAAKQNLLFACLHKAAVHQQRRQAVQVGPTWLGTLKCSPAGALVALRVERSADCVRQSEERLFGIWKQMSSFDELSIFLFQRSWARAQQNLVKQICYIRFFNVIFCLSYVYKKRQKEYLFVFVLLNHGDYSSSKHDLGCDFANISHLFY